MMLWIGAHMSLQPAKPMVFAYLFCLLFGLCSLGFGFLYLVETLDALFNVFILCFGL